MIIIIINIKKYKTKYLDLKGGKMEYNVTNLGIWENNYYKPFGL